MTDLAKRWMESKHWGGWRVGMVGTAGEVCVGDDDEGAVLYEHCGAVWRCPPSELIPDLTHPGTLAFLLEDVRRAWGVCVSAMRYSDGWSCVAPCPWDMAHHRGRTEAEALILALEAAP